MSTAALNVVYEGLILAKGAEARATDAGLFVALAAPMPVGTRLDVEHAGEGGVTRRTVRVTRTVEVGGAGEVGVILADEAGGRVSLDDLFPGAHAPEAVAPEVTIRDASAESAHTESASALASRTEAAASSAGIPANLISRLSPNSGVPIVELTAEPSTSHASAMPAVSRPADAAEPAASMAPAASPPTETESEDEPRGESESGGDARGSDGASDKNGSGKKGKKAKRGGGGPRR